MLHIIWSKYAHKILLDMRKRRVSIQKSRLNKKKESRKKHNLTEGNVINAESSNESKTKHVF